MTAAICMNETCRTTTSPEWKSGWILKSGGLATLCQACGLAYENSSFCENFHREESGWRECRFCGKNIHCGCIASKCLHDYLDLGGVGCLSCIVSSESQLIRKTKKLDSAGNITTNRNEGRQFCWAPKLSTKNMIPSDDVYGRLGTLGAICDPHPSVIENHIDGNAVCKENNTQMTKTLEENQRNGPNIFLQCQKGRTNSSIVQTRGEEKIHPVGKGGTGFSHLSQQSIQSSVLPEADGNRTALELKDMYESLAQPSLSFSFSTPTSNPNSLVTLPGGVIEGREKNKIPPFQQGQRTRHILPKPSKSSAAVSSQGTKGAITQTRVARPPVEGRGRSQLLPRYWPKITDQELQKICGDLNSTIVPLFEKVLSASDAGRIGRLVLPKACAEAYFPPINQSEGVPIRMKDIKGNEWTFQFRFWPNNNSRMYVLEGVTPCIQNMQLEAGDTVTFSRIDPEGKLVMGCRKASNSVDIQDTKTSIVPTAVPSGDSIASALNEGLTTDTFGWRKNEEHDRKMNGDSMHQQMIPEKKKSRNIGSKSKRLLIHNEDAIELRITWEEAQELLRPPPSAKPTIVMVDNHEFEEYDEPPVFGKRTIFTTRESGEQEQWAQCDSCSKWRRLTIDILVPAKWECSDNISALNRCSDPDEIDTKKLESYFRGTKDFKKRRFTENRSKACEASGLDALATAAVLGDHVEVSGEPSVGVTTRHPRHRPGCTCIVCIQPPSGKGKHKPTCICNVCMTVKRRFKTLMLRKKKRQEREAEIEREKGRILFKDESELEGTSEDVLLHMENEKGKNGIQMEVAGSSKEHLDLNCDPDREEDMLLAGMRTPSVVHATHPSVEEMPARQNEEPYCPLYTTIVESEVPPRDEVFLASSIDMDVVLVQEKGGSE